MATNPPGPNTPPTVVQAGVHTEQRFRVVKTTRIPQGAASYTLMAGKEISSHGYDLAHLRRLGVELVPIN